MSIGYACLVVGVPNTNIRSVIKKNATEEKLAEVIQHNLQSLENMVDFNMENNIMLYRISSDLIPFGSSPVNTLDWQTQFAEDFRRIGQKIQASGMRVSFHPGQYTVLNSPNEDVVERAVEDLRYHADVLDCLGTDGTHKIILHVGGIYNDKEAAIARFVENYQRLDEKIKRRLIIENDDRLFTVGDVLEISERAGIPVVYDNLHNAINPTDATKDDAYWIDRVAQTWKPEDGRQKIHYSQQSPTQRPGAHTQTIYLDTFLEFYHSLSDPNIDIMLEVKDKNISAVKCVLATEAAPRISLLEKEWARYKYAVLEKSPSIYEQIRQLLKDKASYPVLPFYQLVEEALDLETQTGQAVNAALHVWGYFRDKATPAQERAFRKNIEKLQEGTGTVETVKRQLLRLAEAYQDTYLLQSLYFYL